MIEEKMKDIESQRSINHHHHHHQRHQNKFIKFFKSDLFLILSLIFSILLLCFLLSSNYNKSIYNKSIKNIGNIKSIPVTNENTLDKSIENRKLDSNKELIDNSITKFDVNEEYRTIVALSPVIIISWDDDESNIPISTIPNKDINLLNQKTEIDNKNNLKLESDFEISKNFKNLLTRNYQILPQPAILSINKHPKCDLLINHIMKKVENLGISKKSNFLPGLIVNGRPVASAKAIESLHTNGKLLEYLKSWGDGVINVDKL